MKGRLSSYTPLAVFSASSYCSLITDVTWTRVSPDRVDMNTAMATSNRKTNTRSLLRPRERARRGAKGGEEGAEPDEDEDELDEDDVGSFS